MMLGIAAFITLLIIKLATPANWEFSVEASTEIAELALPRDAETRWQIDGAVLCVRGDLDLPLDLRADVSGNPCGSRLWKAWRLAAPEQVLHLSGGVSVTLQMQADGGLAMSVRPINQESESGPARRSERATRSEAAARAKPEVRFSVVGFVEEADLGASVNLIWPQIPDRTLTFPFSGATTVGRDVAWSSDRMLRSGKIVVYTADESADKRSRVDEAELMLGDQVRLKALEPNSSWPMSLLGWRQSLGSWPKGFIRVNKGETSMHVVAFGRARSLLIERFGESGYEFEPGLIRKLAADPAIAFWGSVLAAYMTLILSLQPFISAEDADSGPATDLLSRFNRWMRKKPRRS